MQPKKTGLYLGIIVLSAALICFFLMFPKPGSPKTGPFWLTTPEGRWFVSNDRYGQSFLPAGIAPLPVYTKCAADKPASLYRLVVLGGGWAQGVPELGGSVSRMLAVMLADRYPDVQVEVINAALTRSNPNAVLNIARDSRVLKPDAMLVVCDDYAWQMPSLDLPDDVTWTRRRYPDGVQVVPGSDADGALQRRYAAHLQDLCHEAITQEVPLVLCTLPVTCHEKRREAQAVMLGLTARLNALVSQSAAAHSGKRIHCYDAAQWMEHILWETEEKQQGRAMQAMTQLAGHHAFAGGLLRVLPAVLPQAFRRAGDGPLSAPPLEECLRLLGYHNGSDEAYKAFKDLLDRKGKDLFFLQTYCRNFIRTGRYSRAVDGIAKLVPQTPQSVQWLHRLGVLHDLVGMDEKAALYFEKALALRPGTRTAYDAGVALGRILISRKDLERAEKLLSSLAGQYPAAWDACHLLGDACFKQERLEAAEMHLRRAVALMPAHARAHYQLALLLNRRKELDAGAGHLRLALSHDPDYAPAHLAWGFYLASQRRYVDALISLKKAAALDPALPGIREQVLQMEERKRLYMGRHLNQARAHLAEGRDAEAAASFERLRAADPEFLEAAWALAWLRATSKDPGIRQSDEALTLAKTVNQMFKVPPPAVRLVLAAAHAEAGDLDEAVSVAEAALVLAQEKGLVEQSARIAEDLALLKAGKTLQGRPFLK